MIRSYSRCVVCLIGIVVLAPMGAGAGSRDFTQSKYPSEKVVDREVSLKSGGQLTIDVEDMDVYVKESSGGKSRVEVYVAGPDRERALEFFNDELRFDLESKGNNLTLESSTPATFSQAFWKRYRNVRVWAIVSVPARLDADISTEDGDLRIDALDGKIRIRTEDGDIELRDLRGKMIEVETEDGDISAASFDGGEISVSTSDGDLEAKEIRGKRVTVSTSDGDILLPRVEADEISVQTSDGDIEIAASGNRLTADCSDGDMVVEIMSEMAVDLSTNDGDITLRMPSTVRADLNLRGDDVSVRGGANIQGTVSERKVEGTLNDGGPLVRARTRDGSIALRVR